MIITKHDKIIMIIINSVYVDINKPAKFKTNVTRNKLTTVI